MAIRWAIANGNFSSTSTWNDGATLGIPTSADDVYSNGFTVNIDQNITVISLNNAVRARDIATPQMTSNTSPSPIVLSNISNSANVFSSFNRNYASTDYSNLGAATGWTQVDFGVGNAPVIDGYTLYGADNVGNNIRSWELQGSNDGVGFTILHVYTAATALAIGAVINFTSIGNTQGYRYYRLNVTANGGSTPSRVGDIDLFARFTAPIVAGGSFNFNTAGVTGNITSLTAPISLGAANLIQVTASAGTVSLNFNANVTNTLNVTSSSVLSHSGAANLNLNGTNFNGGTTSANVVHCINKSSSGTITIAGNLNGSNTSPSGHALLSTNGNTIVIGNVVGGNNGPGINQSSGNITVTGNVNGGGSNGILSTSTGTITITGVQTAGSAAAVNTTTSINNLIGSINGGTAAGFGSSSSIQVNVTGNVTASANNNGILLSNSGAVVRLAGNMFNTSTRNAIFAANLFIDNTSTTQWRIFDSGGVEKSLYSADFTPNAPPQNRVRFGVTYGFGGTLVGTDIIPSAANTRKGVPVDNTVGTAELTSEDFLNGISGSTHPIAIRLKNIATVQSTGEQVASYNV